LKPESSNREPAVVLLSGGLDSATVLAMAVEQGYAVHALSFDYGQHCRTELDAAARLARAAGAPQHLVLPLSLDEIGGSALTEDRPVPAADAAALNFGIPETYVPARNTVFLAVALGWAEVLGAHTIFIGANSLDYSGYPDCRPEYLEAFNRLAALATAEGSAGGRPVTVEAPLMHMSKAEIIKEGLRLGVDFSLTVSCYQPSPDNLACGSCESCTLRLKGFADAGINDPIEYVSRY